MKKTRLIIALFLLAAILTGCQGQQAPTRTPEEMAQQYELVKQEKSQPTEAAEQTAPPADHEGAASSPVPLNNPPHLDLSEMSYTMAYGQVYSMVMAPKRNQGQTLRIQGSYYGFKTDEGEVVNLVLITDETGCCEVGMEFRLTGQHQWPEDYPPNNSVIRITGLMDVTDIGGNLYPLLIANELEVVKAAVPPGA